MPNPIPVIDVSTSFAAIRPEIDAAVARVLDSGGFVLGAEMHAFEEDFAAAFGLGHVLGVADGTDALHLALRGLGVGPGDKVAIPAMTFFATAEAVVHAGATPVIVDVDEATSTMDPKAFARVAAEVKAVMPVHLYGHPADMDAIKESASAHDVIVIEDAAQAHAAKYKGHNIGTLGDAAGFSFYPTKNLGGAGDGGAVATQRDDVAKRIVSLRHHGQSRKDIHDDIGWTSRLDDLQAAILRVRLRHLDAYTKARRQIAAWYREALGGLNIDLPNEAEWAEAVYHLYVIRTEDRDRVAASLREDGIGCAVHYQVPLNRQPALVALGIPLAEAPVAERIVARQLTIPMYPEMTFADVERVASALRKATA
ncbi:MAG: DegT/DnrJ/EryC1/StrS family aminotransferase [Actinomycetota bacterium]